MKLSFLLCFVVFTSFVVGQFDQGRDELSPLSLSQTVDTTRHDEFSDSVLNQGVINNNCREAFHEVRNVRTDNGPMNSGTYFLIEFDTDINSQPINFYLYDPIADYEFEIHDTPTAGSSTGPVGTCPSNSNCQFEYYCDLYEETDTSTLEIIVFTPSGTLSSENSTYDLTFTQFVDVVSVIPSSRTFTQSTGVTDPFDSSNLGPENFIHYYHNFEATANELVDGRSFFIILDNFNTNTDGDVTVCYSPSNLVGTDQDVSSVSPLSPVNGNPDPTQSATVFASDCPVTCAAGNINNGVGFVYLPVDACDLCELGDLWIGVRPPSNTIESTYTISLTTDNLEPSITTISSYPFMTDSQLQEECIVDEGDYSCNDYYLLNNINLQDNSYITVELFGVSNMDATVQLTQSGLGGVSSCCASSINSCNVNANNGDDYCSFTFYGCNSLSGDYYITVIDNSDFVTDIPSFYTLRVTSGTYSAKSISPFAEPVHETNSLRPNQYAHYSVDFTGFDIEASTNFIAEMYASDEFSETMFFSWNSGSLAGDQGCFEYGGICATNSDCDYYDGNDYFFFPEYVDPEVNTLCRFQFLGCPGADNENIFTGINGDGNGIVSLENDIYYFSVFVPTFTDYAEPTAHFTLNFFFQNPVALYDNVPYPSEVYSREFTRQYVVHVPEDQSITEVIATIDNVQNGVVTLFARCGSPAGSCPCNTFDNFCTANAIEDDFTTGYDYQCDISIPMCSDTCRESRTIYLSVLNEVEAFEYYGYYPYAPTQFVVSVDFNHAMSDNEMIPIEPSYEGTLVTGNIIRHPVGYGFFFGEYTLYNFNSVFEEGKSVDFYRVTLNNNLEADSLFFTLTILNEDLSLGEFYSQEDVYQRSSAFAQLQVSQDYVKSFNFAPECGAATCFVFTGPIYNYGDEEYNWSSYCTVPLYGCQNTGCNRLTFENSADYYVSVSTFNLDYDYFGHRILYSLEATLGTSVPAVLTSNVPVHGTTSAAEYHHYSYSLGNPSSNSKLSMKLYRNPESSAILNFFANYYDGTGDIVLAGSDRNCYEHMFCNTCQLSGLRENLCVYEVPPCILSQQNGGTYYLSVQANSNDFVYYYDYTDYSLDSNYAQYIYNYFPAHTAADYTIEIEIQNIEEITVGASSGNTIVGEVEKRGFKYYEINVPSVPSGLVGYEFLISFTTYENPLYVLMSTDSPDTVCSSIIDFDFVDSDSIAYFTRAPCETESSTYYLTVIQDASFSNDYYYYYNIAYDDDDCDKPGFAIHTQLFEISEISVNLSNDADPRIDESYDSSLSSNIEENSLTIEHNEIQVISFDISASEGEFFAVIIEQDTITDSAEYDIYLTSDSFFIPFSTSPDSFGLEADSSSCVSPLYSDTGVVGQRIVYIVQPCDVDQGTTEWFLTLSGQSSSVDDVTGVITIEINKYTTETINVPASDVFTPVTTSLTFGDSDVDEYSYTTSSSLGLSGGEELEFQVTNADQLYVRYNGETGPGECDVSCVSSDLGSTQSCSIFACDNISQDDWFIYIIGDNSASGTFTITRSAASPSDPNDIETLTLNNVQTFSSLSGSGDDYDNEFQYFQFTIPASDESRFELETNGIDSSDIYYVSSTSDVTFMPGFTASGADEYVMFSGGATDPSTCGAFQLGSLPTADCCYDTLTYVFAVVGSTGGDYDLNPTVFDHITNRDTVSLPASVSETVLEDTIDLITFNVNNGDDIYFEFSVTTGNADIYLNRGDIAGSSDGSMNEPGYCWPNDGIVGSSLCPSSVSAGNSCSGLRYACLESCDSQSSSVQYTFAIAANVDTDYTLEIYSQTSPSTLNLGSNSVSFPDTLAIEDDSDFNDSFGVVSQFRFVYSEDPANIFSPSQNDPDISDNNYPRVQFVFDNFVDASDNTPVDADELIIFIQSGSPAGSPSCLSGSDITSGRSFLPCMENGSGAAEETTNSITCSINVCDLSCGEEIYFGVARSSNTATNYEFDITITELYDDLDDDYRLINLNAGQSNSFTPEDTNEPIYIQLSYGNLNQAQFTVTTITPTGDASTVLDIETFSVGSCFDESDSNIECNNVDTTETCILRTDPCTAGHLADDPNSTTLLRITRESGTGVFGFTIDSEIISISPIDSSATRLSSSNPSYSATKEIEEGQWQFYDFFVDENDGYSTIEVTVNNVGCNDGDIEVYMSWGDDSGNYVDSAKPGVWPTSLCNNLDSNTPSVTSYNMDTCEFNAGSYRVGIFGTIDSAVFPDPINGEDYPITYDISATLSTLEFITVDPFCTYTQTVDSNFIPRYEVNIPATSPGTVIYFEVTYDHEDDDDTDATFTLSNVGFPAGSSELCHFHSNALPTSIERDLILPTLSARVDIQSCISTDGKWYVYFENISLTEGGEIEFSTYIEYYTAPVYDLTQVDSLHLTGLILDDDDQHHTYKIYTDSSFYVHAYINEDNCDFTFEEARISIIEGGSGISSIRNTLEDDCSTCSDMVETCDFDNSNDCFFVEDTCNDIDFYYIVITNIASDYADYVIDVQSFKPSNAITSSINTGYSFVTSVHDIFVFDLSSISNSFFNVEITTGEAFVDVRIGNSLDCFVIEDLCEDDCDYEINGCDFDLDGLLYVAINTQGADSCINIPFYVTIEVTSVPVDDVISLSLNTPLPSLSSGLGRITSNGQWLRFEGNGVSYIMSDDIPDASCITNCDAVLENSGISGTNTYYFDATPGLTVTSFDVTQINAGSSQTFTFTEQDEVIVFAIPVQNSLGEYLFYVEDLEFSGVDFDTTDDIDIAYTFDNTITYGCSGFCGTFPTLSSSCYNSYSGVQVDSQCGDTEFIYVSLSLCDPITCDISFTVRVETSSEFESVTGTNHNAGFTSVSTYSPDGCTAAETSFTYFVDNVDGLFYASIRNVYGGSVSLSYSGSGCATIDSCTAQDTQYKDECSCSVSNDECISRSMCGNGPSVVSITADSDTTFEYQIITQFVDIASNSVSNTIYGETAHFYRITNANQAISVDVTVEYGPALDLSIIDGCQYGNRGYYESRMCFYGKCSFYIATESEHTRTSELYLSIESAKEQPFAAANQEYYEKETSYIVDVTRGTANCGAPPSSGFCSDVLNNLSNSAVWSFDDVNGRNNEAECYYDIINNGCSRPSSQCETLLKSFACLRAFPQCSSSGFQMGTCNELCTQIHEQCSSDIIFNLPPELVVCENPSYVSGTNGTCIATFPTPDATIVDPNFNPRQFFEDNANTIVIAPDNIVLPYFPPIIATMPPIILDDDDGNNKMIEHNIIENTENNDVANTSNILSTSVYLLVLSMVITLIF